MANLLVVHVVLAACSVALLHAKATAAKRTRSVHAVLSATASLDGFYTDPNHFKGDSFAGTRMLSTFPGKGEITLVGSDDGETFWTLQGRFTDESEGKLVV